MTVRGEFIRGAAAEILLVRHEPEQPSDEAVIVFPAIFDEMNKSRRLIWQVSTFLAQQGVTVLIPDLYGTGDSAGESLDARWNIWCDDMARVRDLADSAGYGAVSVLGIRLGCALLTDLIQAGNSGAYRRAVLWHPPSGGQEVVRQMLRMKIMSDRMGGGPKRRLSDLEQELYDRESPALELAGYFIHPDMGRQLAAAGYEEDALASQIGVSTVLRWGSASAGDGAEAQSRDTSIHHETMTGQRFWMAAEPGPNPALVSRTVEALVQR